MEAGRREFSWSVVISSRSRGISARGPPSAATRWGAKSVLRMACGVRAFPIVEVAAGGECVRQSLTRLTTLCVAALLGNSAILRHRSPTVAPRARQRQGVGVVANEVTR